MAVDPPRAGRHGMTLLTTMLTALRNGVLWLAGDLFARLLIAMTTLCGVGLTLAVALHGLVRSEDQRRPVRQTLR